MEQLLEEINSGRTVDTVKELKGAIVECAKAIKSNDATFKISTLPEVTDKLTDLTSEYIGLMQQLEAGQKAFTELAQEVQDQIDNEANQDEYLNLTELESKFKQSLEASKSVMTGEVDAHNELDSIIRPREPRQQRVQVDEEVVVEDSERQIPKDPITKRDIKIAVKSSNCNHVYDQSSINSYFTQREKSKSKVHCPVAGCSNKNMKRGEIILDEETNDLIQSIQSRNN